MRVRPRFWAVPWWRWVVVFAGVAVLCCVPALVSALPASVPAISARQLEHRILASQSLSFDGYAESDAAFGLPSFPAFSTVTPLLDGVTRMRVWQASPDHWRVDTLSDAGENDTYQAGNDAYVWNSGEQLLTAIVGRQAVRLPRAADLTPEALSVRIINAAGPSTDLRPLAARRVAGQGAAGLAVIPASRESTIGQADIWADPATGLPLLVEVYGRGAATPALTSTFLQVGSWKPDPGILTPQLGPRTGFTSTTPANFAGVLKNLDDEMLPGSLGGLPRRPSPAGFSQIGIYGDGLATFAVLTFRHGTGDQLLNDALDAGAAPLSVPDGIGVVASAPLLNLALIHPYASPDTFLLVGLVSKDTLVRASTVLAAKPDQDQ
ncbi:MAG TPA: hypothetical protein VF060_15230 [Trebonia sp.]